MTTTTLSDPMAVLYNVSEGVDYYLNLVTTVRRENVTEAATDWPAFPERLLSADYTIATANNLLSSTPPPPSTSAADTVTAAAVDYAVVRNVSVALCRPSNGIPSVDQYFTGKSHALKTRS